MDLCACRILTMLTSGKCMRRPAVLVEWPATVIWRTRYNSKRRATQHAVIGNSGTAECLGTFFSWLVGAQEMDGKTDALNAASGHVLLLSGGLSGETGSRA